MTSVELFDQAVRLEGGVNFRDLGGYRTTDGRAVRRGLVYRSGSLSGLTAADQERLGRLGIRLICDFRARNERQRQPSRWPADDAVRFWFQDHETSAGDIFKAMGNVSATAAGMRALMIESYGKIVYEHADGYKALFRRIAEDEVPVLFHCAAGKDRTGVAAALLLTLLGVDQETVVEDYLLTERYTHEILRSFEPGKVARDLGQAVLAPLFAADRAYLAAMFETIQRRHGTTGIFMREVLEVDAAMAARICDRLLV